MKLLKNPLIISLFLLSLFIPLLNAMIISPIYTIIYNDVTYPLELSDFIDFIYDSVNILSVYGVCFCLTVSAVSKKHRCFVYSFSAISLVIIYFIMALVDKSFYGTAAISASYVRISIINCLLELLRYVAVILIAEFSKRKKSGHLAKKYKMPTNNILKRHLLITALVVFVISILNVLSNTAYLIWNYGAPANISEVFTIVFPYLAAILYFAAAYAALHIIASKSTKPTGV